MRALHGNAPAQRLHTFQVLFVDGLAVVEEPVQPFKGNLPVHLLIHIQKAGNALIIGGVEAERPFIGGQQADYALQFGLHICGKVRPGFQKVFKIRGGKNEHFARAVAAVIIVPFPGFRHLDPLGKIFLLSLGLWVNKL